MLSQKDLKREIYSQRDSLPNKDLFLSKEYGDFLTQMAEGVTECNHHVSSTLFCGQDRTIAYTDGEKVNINYESILTNGLDKAQRHMLYCGLNLHECGHVLFTDFGLHEKVLNDMAQGRIFPTPAQNDYLEALRKFIEVPGNHKYVTNLFHSLDNCIEDGFVDRAVMAEAPGYARCLRYVNQIDKALDMETYEDMIDNGLKPTSIFLNLTLVYARHGIVLFPDDFHDELTDMFRKTIPYINDAVFEPYPLQRKKAVWTVFCYLFHFFELQSKQQEQGEGQNGQPQDGESGQGQESSQGESQQQSSTSQAQGNGQQQSGEPSQGQESSQGESQQQSSTSQAQGNGQPQDGESGQGQESSQGESQQQSSTSQAQGNGQPQDGESGQGQGLEGGQGESQQQSSTSQAQGNGQQQSGEPGQDQGLEGGQGESQQQIIEEILKNLLDEAGENMTDSERSLHTNTSSPSDEVIRDLSKKMKKVKETTAPDAISDTGFTSALNELEKIAEKVVQSQICDQQEKNIEHQMGCDIKTFLDGINCHKNVTAIAKRASISASAKEKYDTDHPELDVIVKRLLAEFQKEIKDRQIGDTLTGLYAGKQFNARDAHRYDKRVMSRKIAPEDIPDMNVVVLIDISASMKGEGGKRLDTAIKCAYITYQFCAKLQIPCSIIGHTTDGSKVVLANVCDEKSLDKKDHQRIFSLYDFDSDSNRDGFAVWYCIKKLEKTSADQKLLMVISDGRPNHDGYGIESGRADCQAAVKHGLKNGITTIAAAIGDPSGVRSVYKDGVSEKSSAEFLDLTDLQKLPKAFVKIIKRRMK